MEVPCWGRMSVGGWHVVRRGVDVWRLLAVGHFDKHSDIIMLGLVEL